MLKWTAISGSELIDARDEAKLEDILPESPAIYIWRRSVIAPPVCESSNQHFESWLTTLSGQPAARIARQALSNCVLMEGLQIGGGGLSEEKHRTVTQISGNRKIRKSVINFVESLSSYTPVIYLGQTNNLKVRVKQHLDGLTELHAYLTEMLGLKWPDTEFSFLKMSSDSASPQGTSVRELLELISQRVLAPFAVKRPG